MRYRVRFYFSLLLTWFLLTSCTVSPFQADDTIPDFLKPKRSKNQPLEFKQIRIVDRSDTRLTIQWDTNHPARGKVQFGRLKPQGRSMRTALRSKHQISYDNLTPGTVYRFQIYAWDGSGHRIKSQLATVRTAGIPPPRIEKISVNERDMYGGNVNWITNLPTKAVFKAGHDTPLNFRTVHDRLTRHHQVHLTQFFPGRPLYYRITYTDSRGVTKRTSLRSFRTLEANYARNKPIEGTFDEKIYDAKNADLGQTPFIERVNDDDYSYLTGTATSGDPSDTTQYFVINLKEIIKPDRAVLFWRDLAYPKQYEILGSEFKHDWETLAKNLNAQDGVHKLTPSGNMKAFVHTIEFADTVPEIQFIKVRIPKGSPYYTRFPVYDFVQLFEFKLFPRSDTESRGPIVPADSTFSAKNSVEFFGEENRSASRSEQIFDTLSLAFQSTPNCTIIRFSKCEVIKPIRRRIVED